ncbi:hypothetical protein V6D40_03480 [Corynebacterium sp. Q4381]|uniref:hypothetical protein n=1 Tax=Corynebacterium sp. Marseille-Q4381 TaxID=3121597 RepID=UPI002FE66B0E
MFLAVPLALAGCAGEQTPALVETETSTVVVSASPESEEPASEEPSREQAAPEPPARAPAAYPGAGGPVPPEARPVATVKHTQYGDVGVFTAPSGNIGCEMWDDGADARSMYCGVLSYNENHAMGTLPNGMAKWAIDVVNGEALAKGDVPAYFEGAFGETDTLVPEVVPYGDVVYFGEMVCAVEEVGVTCWDARTGSGAFMEREYTVFF